MAARGEGPPSRPQAPSIASARLPPVTQHPLSRLGAPDSLALRGHAPSGQQPAGGSGCTRAPPPPPPEPQLRPRFRGTRSPQPLQEASAPADPGKPKLPVFGQRADIGNPAVSRASLINRRTSLLSQPGTQLRIEADELEHILHEKMRSGGYFTVRQLFKNNDPEGKGKVSRDVLRMMLTKFLGRYISFKQFQKLLLRQSFGLKRMYSCSYVPASLILLFLRYLSWLAATLSLQYLH